MAKQKLAGMTKRERKQLARISEAITEKLGDVVMSREMYNAANKVALMTLEVHELLEAELVDYVHVDCEHSNLNDADGKGVHVMEVETEDGTAKVLCIPPDANYEEWRAVYDELLKGK